MRSQSWNQIGQLVEDIELTRVGDVATTIDHLIGTSRPTNTKETELLLAEERGTKIQQARERAVIAIKTNTPNSPWGKILFDLAIAQGLVEPE